MRFRSHRLHRVLSVSLMLMILLTATGQVQAADGLRGFGACVVEEDEVILNDFYFACTSLTIHGYIDGDVAGIASKVTIARQGQVTGDIWIVGGQLTIEGIVGDDLHFGGVDLDITGLAQFPHDGTDVVAAAASVEIANGTLIPGDVIFYGYQALIRAKINGGVDFQGQSLTIQNTVAGNVSAIVGNPEASQPISTLPVAYSVDFQRPGLFVNENRSRRTQGYIHGDLSYESPQRIILDDEAIGGDIFYTQSVQAANIAQVEQSDTFLQIVGNYILVTIRDIIALSMVGILTLNFLMALITEPAYRVQKRPISAFSWGLVLTFLSIPTGLFLILSSLVLALIVFVIALNAIEISLLTFLLLLVLNLGFVGLFFFLWAFVGRAITCFVIGFFILRAIQRLWIHYRGEAPPVLGEIWLAIVVGVTLISAIVHLPLGSFVNLMQLALTGAVCSAGLGAIFMYIRDVRDKSNGKFFFLQQDFQVEKPPQIPADTDILEDLPLGMDNLPAGFRGFDD